MWSVREWHLQAVTASLLLYVSLFTEDKLGEKRGENLKHSTAKPGRGSWVFIDKRTFRGRGVLEVVTQAEGLALDCARYRFMVKSDSKRNSAVTDLAR